MREKKENTPFVIDFRQKSSASYGSADVNNTPTTSSKAKNNNNIENSNNGDLIEIPKTPSNFYCLHGQTPVEVRDHCHRQRSEGIDVSARRKLIIASVLCLFFMICEIIGGVLSNSLAIATDAAHLLTDFASFMISLFAIWLAGRPSTQRLSFGWYRAEVIGAMASVFMIWIITGILVWLAVERIINQNFELDAGIMLITSGLAIVVNIIMGFQLHHGHSHGGHGHSHGGKKELMKKSEEVVCITDLDPQQLEKDSKTLVAAISLTSLGTPRTSRTSLSDVAPPSETPIKAATEVKDINATADNVIVSTTPVDAQICCKNQFPVVESATVTAASSLESTDVPRAENINVRAALIHVIGDMLQSVGVFIAAIVIYFKPEWAIVDPICTFLFSLIVLSTTFYIMSDALMVLMEGTPDYNVYAEVLQTLQNIPGVRLVHNLRIWALSINKVALSVHLAIEPNGNARQVLQEANRVVHKRYNFFETTIQIEDYTPAMQNCRQCVVPAR